MATATATGNIFLWDFNYDRNSKSRSLLGSYQSACQGLSWNNKDTNLLLSCFQEGVILLWVHNHFFIHSFDRRQEQYASKWSLNSSSSGVSYVKFDPFHPNHFCCIHDDKTIKLFDMASTSLNHIFCYEATGTITTIHYNPYKPNIMAAGTANKSILLFYTASHKLSNLYASFSHLPGQQDYCPEGIRTEFEIKDISWNPQNPNVLAACGMADGSAVAVWDIRRPSLPFRFLSQTQKINEVCWMTHPGSTSSEEYLSVLQQRGTETSIDVFQLRSLPLFSSIVCMSALSITNYQKIAVVLNATSREKPHIPLDLKENQLFSLTGENSILVVQTIDPSDAIEGFMYNQQRLIYLAHHYRVLPCEGCQSTAELCKYNADICRSCCMPAIETIWLLLKDLVEAIQDEDTETVRIRSHSFVSPHLTPSRGNSISSYHRENSVSECSSILESNPCALKVQLNLKEDLSFIPALVREGDIQNAVMISFVMWEFLKHDELALKEVPTWVDGYLDLLNREQLYEEVVALRNVCHRLKIQLLEVYNSKNRDYFV
ncbi:LOW QUALITY PROTEIN: uncharacterized protein [Blastocystis hominis]|uniref:Uncharacterized protein n=1 Tax=Blastocystis hominis TaxID=12968 RepID=D8LZG5_BLAHO|nr:LOW QUALITY PROTEIN: uncharacterized protein [Blastocystis hominis]CBK21204.2 unnamed protein product [Blastocystis hominis]|eukprot:XP_012895252.1 LOW QUALITY PROTEIN: uncharacterized protein [Blastocystis hominis]